MDLSDFEWVCRAHETALSELEETGGLRNKTAAEIDRTLGWANTHRAGTVRLSEVGDDCGEKRNWFGKVCTAMQSELRQTAYSWIAAPGRCPTGVMTLEDQWHLDLLHKRSLEVDTRDVFMSTVSSKISLKTSSRLYHNAAPVDFSTHCKGLKAKWDESRRVKVVLSHAATSVGSTLLHSERKQGGTPTNRESLKHFALIKFLTVSERLLEMRDTKPKTMEVKNGTLQYSQGGFLHLETTQLTKQAVRAAYSKATLSRGYLLPKRAYQVNAKAYRDETMTNHQRNLTTTLQVKNKSRMNIVVADDPGTGKATTVIYYLSEIPGMHLIVAPDLSIPRWSELCIMFPNIKLEVIDQSLAVSDALAKITSIERPSSLKVPHVYVLAYGMTEAVAHALTRPRHHQFHTMVLDFKGPSQYGKSHFVSIMSQLSSASASHRVLLMSRWPMLDSTLCYCICQFLFPITYGGVKNRLKGWLETQITDHGYPYTEVSLDQDEDRMVARRLLQMVLPFVVRRERDGVGKLPDVMSFTLDCPMSFLEMRLYWVFCNYAAEGGAYADDKLKTAAALTSKALSHPFLIHPYASQGSWVVDAKSDAEYLELLVSSSGKLAMLDCLIKEVTAKQGVDMMHKMLIYTAEPITYEMLFVYLESTVPSSRLSVITGDTMSEVEQHRKILNKFTALTPGIHILLMTTRPIDLQLTAVDTLVIYDSHIPLATYNLLLGRCRTIGDPVSLRVIRLQSVLPDGSPTIDRIRRVMVEKYVDVCTSDDNSSAPVWVQHLMREMYCKRVLREAEASFQKVAEEWADVAGDRKVCVLSEQVRNNLEGNPVRGVKVILGGSEQCPELLANPLAGGRVMSEMLPCLRGATVQQAPLDNPLTDTANDDVLGLFTFETCTKGVLTPVPFAEPPAPDPPQYRLTTATVDRIKASLAAKRHPTSIVEHEPLSSLLQYCKRESILVEFTDKDPEMVKKWLETVQRGEEA